MLNTEQQEAVDANGSVCILSGAGTGKTETISRVVSERCRRGVSPDRIFVSTFTNKAAREMAERIEKHGTPHIPYLGTFHANALRIMRSIMDRDDLKIARDDALTSLVANNLMPSKQDCPELYEKNTGVTPHKLTVDFLKCISLLKSNIILPCDVMTVDFPFHVKDMINKNPYLETFIKNNYLKYDELMKHFYLMDFDDILLYPILISRMSRAHEDLMASFFDLVVVDEHQDSCLSQRELAHILSRDSDLVTVGDDGQSIYGWRGANVEMMRLDASNPRYTPVTLFRNYRSTPGILALGNSVISFDEESLEKTLVADGDNALDTSLPEYRNFYRPQDEAKWIASDIAYRLKNGEKIQDIAVLARGNNGVREVENALIKKGIKADTSSINLWEYKEIRFIVSWLNIMKDPFSLSNSVFVYDILNLKSNLIAYGLGGGWLKALQNRLAVNNGDSQETFYSIIEKDETKKVQMFKEQFLGIVSDWEEMDGNGTLLDLINIILDRTGLLEAIRNRLNFIKDACEQGVSYEVKYEPERETLQNRLDNIDAIREIADDETLDTLLEQASLGNAPVENDGVAVMTIHGAKGLEWDTVYLFGMSEKQLKTTPSNPEFGEACRLLYVAVTRPRKRLFVSSSDTYYDSSDRVSHIIGDALSRGLLVRKSSGSGSHSIKEGRRLESPLPFNSGDFKAPKWFKEKIGFETIADMMRGH